MTSPRARSVRLLGIAALVIVAASTVACEREAITGTQDSGPVVASLEVTPERVEGWTGDTVGLTATPRDEKGEVLSSVPITWSSTDSSVATVEENGLVTLRSRAGTAVVVAVAAGLATATDSANARNRGWMPDTVEITPASAALEPGEKLDLEATVRDVSGAERSMEVTWTTSDDSVATVSETGVATGHAEGQAILTAQAGPARGSAEIRVDLPAVASVTVAPDSTELGVEETVQLSVTLESSEGDTLDRDVTWNTVDSSVAEVDNSGLVTGVEDGFTGVVATSEGVSDTATVAVVPEPPTAPTGVQVSEAARTDTTVTYEGTWDQSARADRYSWAGTSDSGDWSRQGSSSDTSEEFTAPRSSDSDPSSFCVSAENEGGTSEESCVGFTVPARDTSDPGDGGGGNAGECSDPPSSWIWCDDFEENRLGQYFEYSDDDGDFVRMEGVGLDGSIGMRVHFQEGETPAGNLHLAFGRTPDEYFDPVDGGTEDYREIYWRVYLRNESDWTGGGGNKLSRATVFANSDWAQAMIAHVWSTKGNPSKYYLSIDPASGTDEEGNLQTTKYNDFDNLRWLGSDRGDTPLFDDSHVGEWYCIEAHVRLNDPNAENGVFELWIDGEKDAERTGLNWVGDYQEYGINAVFVENYWNDGSVQDQKRYLDNFVVSTERIGC